MKRKDAKIIRTRLALIVRKGIERVGKKRADIAQEAGIAPSMLTKILSEHGNVPEEVLEALGRVLWNDKDHIKNDKVIQRTLNAEGRTPSRFALNLHGLMQEKNIKKAELARRIGVTPTVITLWLKAGCEGGTFPNESNMKTLATFFDLSVTKLKSTVLFKEKEDSEDSLPTDACVPIPTSTEKDDFEPEAAKVSPPTCRSTGQYSPEEEDDVLDWEGRCKVLEAEVSQLKRELAEAKAVKATESEPIKQPIHTVSPFPVLHGLLSEVVNAVIDIIEQRKS